MFHLSLKSRIKKFKGKRLVAIICKDEENFTLYYIFDINGKLITLQTKISKQKPIVDSITEMFPSADYYEREIHDFFGVEFKGNSKLHLKLFLPEDWKEKPPLKK